MGGGWGSHLAGHPPSLDPLRAPPARRGGCRDRWRADDLGDPAAARLRDSPRPQWAIASRYKRAADYETAPVGSLGSSSDGCDRSRTRRLSVTSLSRLWSMRNV